MLLIPLLSSSALLNARMESGTSCNLSPTRRAVTTTSSSPTDAGSVAGLAGLTALAGASLAVAGAGLLVCAATGIANVAIVVTSKPFIKDIFIPLWNMFNEPDRQNLSGHIIRLKNLVHTNVLCELRVLRQIGGTALPALAESPT